MNTSEIYRGLFAQLYTEGYTSAKVLCEKFSLSKKTMRKYIHELDSYLSENGARIEAQPRKGYRAVVTDPNKFLSIYRMNSLQVETGYSAEERMQRLLICLLEHHGFVPYETLTETCCASDATVNNDIRVLKRRLKANHVNIEVKLSVGTRISGPELELRRCLQVCMVYRDIYGKEPLELLENLAKINAIVMAQLSASGLSIPEVSLYNLVFNLYIAILRIRGGFPIVFTQEQHKRAELYYEKVRSQARLICAGLSEAFGVTFDEEEILYVTLYLVGNRAIQYEDRLGGNIVISEHIQAMTEKILQAVYESMGYDFREDLALRLDLWKHLTAMDIRIRYGILLDNPMLEEIKKEYGKAFLMGQLATSVLEAEYGKKIMEQETGYLAALFGLCLELSRDPEGAGGRKKNVLFVCESGKASANLLAIQYRRAFPDSIGKMLVCNQIELQKTDLSDFDCIITTMPIWRQVSLPIIEVKNILDITRSRDAHRKLTRFFSRSPFYKAELFFHAPPLDTKEEVLRYMRERISSVERIDDGFLESILRRESMGSTDYFGAVAMPHPIQKVSKEDFACVCVLAKPVPWGNREVRLVILPCISEAGRRERDLFFDRTADFMLDQRKVADFLEDPSFDRLMEMMET